LKNALKHTETNKKGVNTQKMMTNPSDPVISCCPIAKHDICTQPQSDKPSRSRSRSGTTPGDEIVNGCRATNEAYPSLRVFSNYAEIQKERRNPFKKKPTGILGIISESTQTRRVVSKVGKINTHRHQKKQLTVIVKDLFISSIQISWSWTFFNFFGSYFLSWFLFAVIWYLIGLTHGDFDPENVKNPEHVVCVDNVVDFTSAFLFSIETQHTIGYGGRMTTEQCPFAILVMSIQSIIGVFLTACMTGIVFAKFTKPTHRGHSLLFSKNALITMRNGAFYLLCRVADLRPTHLIESHISAYVVRREVTAEGEEIPHHLWAIEFGTDLDGTQDFFQLFWPIVLSHRIDESSPLWSVSPTDLVTEKFEIIVTVEGTTPETGNNIQVRSSYLPSEILWGYKFEHSCVEFNTDLGKYEVSFDALNTIIKDNTPCMSPKSYEEMKKSSQ